MRLVSFRICPFVQYITALLAAKQQPCDIDYISLRDKPVWFLEISPTGQVPILITDDNIALFESSAIAEYLDEVFPPLQPDLTPEQRALERAWCFQATKHYLVQCSAQRSSDWDTLHTRAEKLGAAFTRAENMLGRGPYFHGDVLGNIDVAWVPLLHRAAIINRYSGFDFLKPFPKVRSWQAALLETDMLIQSVDDAFEDAFKAFYLSQETVLGRTANVCCTPDALDFGRYACC
ncbi:MAG: glutathione S-transferase family protein [Pseudomonadota bacterium]